MVVEIFFMSKSQPHRCYLVSSVVLIIIILLLSFNTFTSNDGKLTTLSYSPEWSYWLYNRKVSIFKIVDQRIKFYSRNTNLLPPKPKSTFRHLKQGIQDFHGKYVLVPADKAANNVVVV